MEKPIALLSKKKPFQKGFFSFLIKIWEGGIKLCKELSQQYEEKLLDYTKLSEILVSGKPTSVIFFSKYVKKDLFLGTSYLLKLRWHFVIAKDVVLVNLKPMECHQKLNLKVFISICFLSLVFKLFRMNLHEVSVSVLAQTSILLRQHYGWNPTTGYILPSFFLWTWLPALSEGTYFFQPL